MQHSATSANDKLYSQYIQQQQLVPQNDNGISLPHAAAGSLLTIEPYRQLNIQHYGTKHQRTSSDMLTLTTNDATLTHKVPTNFVLNPTQPKRGADHPGGPQACAVAVQM